jgi:hypothetical protein
MKVNEPVSLICATRATRYAPQNLLSMALSASRKFRLRNRAAFRLRGRNQNVIPRLVLFKEMLQKIVIARIEHRRFNGAT